MLVAHVHDEAHVVLDEEDPDAPLVGESPHELGELGALRFAEAGGRLVEQEDRRLRGHRPGDPDQPPPPEGQVRDPPVEVVLERRTRGCRDGRRVKGGSAGHTRPVSSRGSSRRASDAVRRFSSTVRSSKSSSDWNERDSPGTRSAVGRQPPDTAVVEARRLPTTDG